jgi:hypothetical protein
MLVLGAPLARADDEGFVRDARALGFMINDENISSMGRSACYFLSRNRHPGQVEERIVRYGMVDAQAARRFLVNSVIEYCPQFSDRVDSI